MVYVSHATYAHKQCAICLHLQLGQTRYGKSGASSAAASAQELPAQWGPPASLHIWRRPRVRRRPTKKNARATRKASAGPERENVSSHANPKSTASKLAPPQPGANQNSDHARSVAKRLHESRRHLCKSKPLTNKNVHAASKNAISHPTAVAWPGRRGYWVGGPLKPGLRFINTRATPPTRGHQRQSPNKPTTSVEYERRADDAQSCLKKIAGKANKAKYQAVCA